MTLQLAASAHHSGTSTATLVLVGLLIVGGYVVACAIWPFAACRHCDGNGKRRSPSGRAWRLCRRCKGTGARVRLGRKAWTAFTGRRDRAARADRSARRLKP